MKDNVGKLMSEVHQAFSPSQGAADDMSEAVCDADLAGKTPEKVRLPIEGKLRVVVNNDAKSLSNNYCWLPS